MTLSVDNRRLSLRVLNEDLGADMTTGPTQFVTITLPDLNELLDAAREEGRQRMRDAAVDDAISALICSWGHE